MTQLPGVRVGPLDPDSTAAFGQVGVANTARAVLRLHAQMHPPELRRALVRPLDDERTKGLDPDEVAEYLGGLTHANGDPYVPEGARVVGAAVRGDRDTGHVLTFTYRTASGRTAKWHAPYNDEALPDSYQAGAENKRLKDLQGRGIASWDSEGTHTQFLQRQLAQSRAEVRRLRGHIETGDPGEVTDQVGDEYEMPPNADVAGSENLAEDNETLRRERDELAAQVAEYQRREDRANAGAPDERSDDERADGEPGADADEAAGAGGKSLESNTASADEPFEGYDKLKAEELRTKIKGGEYDRPTVEQLLAYERTHSNRGTVVGAAEQALG